MTKYFTIAASGLTPAEEKALAQRWAGYGWWHGVTNFWLLKDPTGTLTAGGVRDTIRSISNTAIIMVVEGQPTMWAGTATTDANREWLRKYWPPESA